MLTLSGKGLKVYHVQVLSFLLIRFRFRWVLGLALRLRGARQRTTWVKSLVGMEEKVDLPHLGGLGV